MQEAIHAVSQMRFPQKLWYLLNLNTDAILWGGTGRTILLNYRVLQHYLKCDQSIFKTTNISSFIRQLNLYGFRKVTSHLQDPLCNSSNPYMHEFIHDNFQYQRPELLNKITRKALTMKKAFKPRIRSLESSELIISTSPLQKARHALRLALKKAAQDLLVLPTPKTDSTVVRDDSPGDCCDEEENIELDWLIHEKDFTKPGTVQRANENSSASHGDTSQDSLMDFNGQIETCQQTNENILSPFLNMPDLDESTEKKSDIELLAEFNINSDTIKSDASDVGYSLNCVLPSVNNQIDDNAMPENYNINHYNGEWDQMYYDMINNKCSNQEGLANFRELYSQISQTIDLLNS